MAKSGGRHALEASFLPCKRADGSAWRVRPAGMARGRAAAIRARLSHRLAAYARTGLPVPGNPSVARTTTGADDHGIGKRSVAPSASVRSSMCPDAALDRDTR